ncbi:MAG: hypothetical protein WCE79_12250 [Xanthobacteraceae bacterium]
MPGPKTIEDALHEALFGVPVKGFSFEPVVACFQDAVKRAKQEERQAILDALLASRTPKKGKHWNAGFNAAWMILMSALADRAQIDHQAAAE